jgi:hypothetical protein
MMQRSRLFIVLTLVLICYSCNQSKDFDTIKFSDTEKVYDSIIRLNNLFSKLSDSAYHKQKNYEFSSDTLYINEEKITDFTIDNAEVLKEYNTIEKREIVNLIKFLKLHDIQAAGLDTQAGLWFYYYGNGGDDDFNRFLTITNNSSDSFRLTLLNVILESRDGILLCQPASTVH